MNAITAVMVCFSVLAALDRMAGNRFGLGTEFDKGFMLYGNLALSVIGMVVISPFLAELLAPVSRFLSDVLHLDPSILPASLFAIDMGGAPLAAEVAADAQIGRFNALVVSSMMGCTISFTVPYALGAVCAEKRRALLMGLLCGVVTIPLGCLAGGMTMGLAWSAMLKNLVPLALFSAVIAAGLVLCPDGCVKVFGPVGRCIQIIVTLGLALAVVRYLTGVEILPGLATLEERAAICLSISAVMTGAFPMMYVVSRVLQKPLRHVAARAGISEAAVTGLWGTMVTSMTTFAAMKDMDEKGAVLNAAFAVLAAFAFADHLAYTLSFDAGALTGVIVGKLSAGVLALIVANAVYARLQRRGKTKIAA